MGGGARAGRRVDPWRRRLAWGVLGLTVIVALAVAAVGRLPAAVALEHGSERVPAEIDVEGPPAYALDLPDPALNGIEMDVDVEALGPGDPAGSEVELAVGDQLYPVEFEDGEATVTGVVFDGDARRVALLEDGQPVPIAMGAGEEAAGVLEVPTIPGWLTILPPIVAIGLALLTRQVIPSLLLGVFTGAWFVSEFSAAGLWYGLLETFDVWILSALVPEDGDSSRMAILIFTMLVGGLTGIISRNGGARGIVNMIVPWAKSRRRGLVSTSAVGTGLFFDDYAGMLVTGNSMRPVTDRLSISREKLAYIVDTTAAPLATLLLVTTWIGFQVGLIADATAGLEGYTTGAYATFFQALPYMFYPLLAFLFMWFVTGTGRDFGPMRRAEERALAGDVTSGDEVREDDDESGDELAPAEGTSERAINALVPIGVLIGVVIATLFITGEGDSITDIVGSADSFSALMYGSVLAVLVAAGMSLGQRLLSLGGVVAAWLVGLKSILEVLVILTLAWALSDVTQQLQTAAFLTQLLGENIPAATLPAIIFVLAAAVAFATGTSWGTMGILLPLSVPLTWSILGDEAVAGGAVSPILYATVAATLAGAVWGDHTSPISDTTVLSSATSGSGVVEHTNTQLPYGIVVGVAAVLGLLAVGFGVPWWIVLPVAMVALAAVVWVVGSVPEAAAEAGDEESPGEGPRKDKKLREAA